LDKTTDALQKKKMTNKYIDYSQDLMSREGGRSQAVVKPLFWIFMCLFGGK